MSFENVTIDSTGFPRQPEKLFQTLGPDIEKERAPYIWYKYCSRMSVNVQF